jgi:hypothetical protein
MTALVQTPAPPEASERPMPPATGSTLTRKERWSSNAIFDVAVEMLRGDMIREAVRDFILRHYGEAIPETPGDRKAWVILMVDRAGTWLDADNLVREHENNAVAEPAREIFLRVSNSDAYFLCDGRGRIINDSEHNVRAMLDENAVTVGHKGDRLLAWHPDCGCWNDLDEHSLEVLHIWARRISGWRPPKDALDRLVLAEARRHPIEGKLRGKIGDIRLGEW